MKEFDISRITEQPRCAVLCSNEEDAKDFLRFIAQCYDDGLIDAIPIVNTHWYDYLEDTCYTLFGRSSETPTCMTVGRKAHFESQGYEIVDVSKLLPDNQPDILESYFDLSMLFS